MVHRRSQSKHTNDFERNATFALGLVGLALEVVQGLVGQHQHTLLRFVAMIELDHEGREQNLFLAYAKYTQNDKIVVWSKASQY